MATTINTNPVTPFTAPDSGLYANTPKKDPKKIEVCKEGYEWSNDQQKCVPIPGYVAPSKPTDQPKNADQVFRDQESGNISGVTIGGKTYLGLNPQDVESMTAAEAAKKGGPATQAFEQGVAQQQKQEQIAQALSQLGVSEEEIAAAQAGISEAKINQGQAITAGLSKAVPGLLGVGAGALLSATGVGSVAGVPIMTASAISAATAIQQAFSGYMGNIKAQQSGEIGAAGEELTAAKTQARQLAMMASRDPANADYYIDLYDKQILRVYEAQRKTKLETQGNLNAFMEDGTEDLAKFETFLRPGGLADVYEIKLRTSLQTGVPLTEMGEELVFDE